MELRKHGVKTLPTAIQVIDGFLDFKYFPSSSYDKKKAIDGKKLKGNKDSK